VLQGPTIRRFQGGILNDGSGGERESDAAPGNCRSNGIQVTFHLIVGNNSMAGCRELKRLIDVAAAAQVTAMCTGPMTERNRCIAAAPDTELNDRGGSKSGPCHAGVDAASLSPCRKFELAFSAGGLILASRTYL